MITVERHFQGGPLDGYAENRQCAGLDLDLARADGPQKGHHYRLASLPKDSKQPIKLSYRYVGEFDPRSDYVEQVAEGRFGEILDPQHEDE